jgi:NAD(P)-dependent dehydrogenase (short-subunit alcohol dehydrogenase family)
MEIKGKVAVITGAASGIGRATAERLACEGASIVVADVDERGGAETVRRIESQGAKALFVRTDVTSESEARRMLETAIEKFGRLDILHNNAGVDTGLPGFPAAALAQWRRVLDIDLTAVIMGTWLAAPIMESRGGGVIVHTASMAGLYPHSLDPIYGAAKAGVVNFTHSLAPWAAEHKIRVNCVCPGIVDTPMVREGLKAVTKAGLKSWAPSHILQPEQIADVVVRLVSDDSMFGCSLEIRPSGPRIVEPRQAPGLRK